MSRLVLEGRIVCETDPDGFFYGFLTEDDTVLGITDSIWSYIYHNVVFNGDTSSNRYKLTLEVE